MKKLAYLANAAFVVALVIQVASAQRFEGSDVLILVLLLALPAINFIALWQQDNARDVLSLYFERKKLEQEKKILELKKSMSKET